MVDISVAGITISHDVTVIVPNSLTLMTPYVLYEQGDWFEDEIHFIRHFVKPGMQILDVGANYGVYTLSMAKIMGNQGKIWAFEPTSSTFACLKESITENAFTNIEPLRLGLSNRVGTAQLHTSQNSELNSLSKEALPSSDIETIELLTLDHCFNTYGWKNIDFIKLDAEGEEINILEAAENLLTTHSPLIMFELKHGEIINLPLVKKFREMEYDTYRLIPGLNVLIPFDETQGFDGYLLNLFCCKKDRAKQLEEQGIIVPNWEIAPPIDFDSAAEFILSDELCEEFREILKNIELAKDSPYLQVLSSYVAFLSNKYTLKERLSYLIFSLNKAKLILAAGVKDVGQLSTFSRIAFDAGERELGVNILSKLIKKHPDKLEFKLNDPFFPAHSQYDLIPPQGRVKEWLFSSIIEKYIQKHAFSTYFSGKSTLPQLLKLEKLGFLNASMSNRYQQLMKVFS